jgi:hypothetical protein
VPSTHIVTRPQSTTRTSSSLWGRNTPRTDLPCSGSPLTGSAAKDVGAAGTQTARVERQYCSSLPKYQWRTAKGVLGLRSVERRMGVRSRVLLVFRAASRGASCRCCLRRVCGLNTPLRITYAAETGLAIPILTLFTVRSEIIF